MWPAERRLPGREKFAFSIAEVTDALALEVVARRIKNSVRKDPTCWLLHCTHDQLELALGL